jgi:hypothetical protein
MRGLGYKIEKCSQIGHSGRDMKERVPYLFVTGFSDFDGKNGYRKGGNLS